MLRPLFQLLIQSAEQGALPQIQASVDPRVNGSEYYGPDGLNEVTGYPVGVKSSAASYNREDAKKRWEVSEQLTGIKFSF